MPSVSLSYYA
jgi:molybdenum cofactor sulfurtransferase